MSISEKHEAFVEKFHDATKALVELAVVNITMAQTVGLSDPLVSKLTHAYAAAVIAQQELRDELADAGLVEAADPTARAEELAAAEEWRAAMEAKA